MPAHPVKGQPTALSSPLFAECVKTPKARPVLYLNTSAGRRSGADVGREVLAGEGGAGGDEVGGRALEDDPAAVVAGAGAEVDDPVGVRHDRLVVLDDDDRLAGVDEPVEQAEQLLDVGEVEAGGRLVEDEDGGARPIEIGLACHRPSRPCGWPA